MITSIGSLTQAFANPPAPDNEFDEVFVRYLSERARDPTMFDELFHILAGDRPELTSRALK
jgi:hypothetical protein